MAVGLIFPVLILTVGRRGPPPLDSPVESGWLSIHSDLHVLEPGPTEGNRAEAGSPGWRGSPLPHSLNPVAACPWTVTRVKTPGAWVEQQTALTSALC